MLQIKYHKHLAHQDLTKVCLISPREWMNVLGEPEKEDLERQHLPLQHSQPLKESLELWTKSLCSVPNLFLQLPGNLWSLPAPPGNTSKQLTFLPKEEFYPSLGKKEGFSCLSKMLTRLEHLKRDWWHNSPFWDNWAPFSSEQVSTSWFV